MSFVKVLLWLIIIIVSICVGSVVGLVIGMIVIPVLVVQWLNDSNDYVPVESKNDDI